MALNSRLGGHNLITDTDNSVKGIKEITIYDADTTQIKYKLELKETHKENDYINHAGESAVDPSGRYFARITGRTYYFISVYDMQTGSLLWKIGNVPQEYNRRGLQFSPDGYQLLHQFMFGEEGTYKLVSTDTITGQTVEIQSVPYEDRLHSFSFLDNQHLWVYVMNSKKGEWQFFEKNQ